MAPRDHPRCPHRPPRRAREHGRQPDPSGHSGHPLLRQRRALGPGRPQPPRDGLRARREPGGWLRRLAERRLPDRRAVDGPDLYKFLIVFSGPFDTDIAMSRRVWLIGGLIAFVVALGGVALAQSTPTPTPTPTPSPGAQAGKPGQPGKAMMFDEFLQHLADRLHISKDQLIQAMKDAGKD